MDYKTTVKCLRFKLGSPDSYACHGRDAVVILNLIRSSFRGIMGAFGKNLKLMAAEICICLPHNAPIFTSMFVILLLGNLTLLPAFLQSPHSSSQATFLLSLLK